jgi:pimeloyl-ACP methyl ester carboxylesterase
MGVGKSSGRPAIWFVHALGDSSDVFDGLLRSPLEGTFDLAAPDWPGSDGVAGRTVDDLEGLACWLAASVDRHTPRVPVGLVGHSLGAAVAVKAAGKLDSVIGVFSIEGNLTAADAYFSGLAMEFDAPRAFHEHLLARVRDLAEGGQSSRHEALRRYHARLGRADPEALWKIGRSAKTASREDALGEEYRALPVPTLYFWSPENTSPETQAYLQKHRLPAVVFTGGHWPMVEQPEETARRIADFFWPLRLASSGGTNPLTKGARKARSPQVPRASEAGRQCRRCLRHIPR